MAGAASVLATAVSGAFAVALVRRWVAGGRRTLSLLTWAISLGMFCIASAALAFGTLSGWSEPTFRTFYLFGAILNVPWLALGTVQINARRTPVTRAAGAGSLLIAGASGLLATAASDTPEAVFLIGAVIAGLWGTALLLADEGAVALSAVVVVALTGLASAVVAAAGLNGAVVDVGLPEGRELFGALPRGLAFGANTAGATIVIVAAVASALHVAWPTAAEREHDRVRRQRTGSLVGHFAAAVEALLLAWRARDREGGDLVAGNLLIAFGVAVAGAGGALSFLGETTGNALGLAIGVTIMYAGFRRTGRSTAA
ncbi:MAG: hypothetical protein KY469_17110 [Actinobacteria bacterium]|nr:hypothetical protein [Actinomycetota bacterium]